jgi:hypothetical protein
MALHDFGTGSLAAGHCSKAARGRASRRTSVDDGLAGASPSLLEPHHPTITEAHRKHPLGSREQTVHVAA